MQLIQQVSLCPHLVQSVRLLLFKYSGGDNAHWITKNKMESYESYAVRISVNISRICEFRFIMGSRANDYVKTLATLGFWLHHSPCSLGCWTNNTLAARSLSTICGYVIRSGRHPEGIQQPLCRPQLRPMTGTLILFIQYKTKNSWSKTAMLWNDKSIDFSNLCLPVRARAKPAEATARKSVRGPKLRAFIEYPRDSTQRTEAPNYIYRVISRKYGTYHFQIQQIINRLTVHDCLTGAPAQVRAYSIKRSYHCDVTVAALETMSVHSSP